MRMRRLGGKRWVLLGRMSRSLLWSASVSYIARIGYSDSVRKTVTAKDDLNARTCNWGVLATRSRMRSLR